MILDKKLTFNQHLKEKISKANKGIGLITRLYAYLPRKTLNLTEDGVDDFKN